MAHASLEELHEAIGELQAERRSRDESRASALDMRRALDQTAAVISRLRARAAAEPEAVAEELVDLFREDGTLLGAASGRAPRWAAVFGEPPIESVSAGGGGRVSFEGPQPSREVISCLARRDQAGSRVIKVNDLPMHFYIPSASPTLPPLKSTAAPVGNIGVQ